MNIAIIGVGRVGKTLGKIWARSGHTVLYGSRTPVLDQNTVERQDAIDQSDVIVLTVPGNSVKDVVSELEYQSKVVIDTTNSPSNSMIETMKIAPQAKFVKAFNTIGFNIMEDPNFGDIPADGFYCTDNDLAAEYTELLFSDCGFNALSVGGSSIAPHLENFAFLWINMSRSRGRNFVFNCYPDKSILLDLKAKM